MGQPVATIGHPTNQSWFRERLTGHHIHRALKLSRPDHRREAIKHSLEPQVEAAVGAVEILWRLRVENDAGEQRVPWGGAFIPIRGANQNKCTPQVDDHLRETRFLICDRDA